MKKILSAVLTIALLICPFSNLTFALDVPIDAGVTIHDDSAAVYATLEPRGGEYYFYNFALENYLQIDNNEDPTYNTNGAFMELWDFDNGAYQEWEIVNLYNGYYEIHSKVSNMSLAVPAGETNTANVKVIQESYSGYTRQQWKFTQTSRGTYIIRPRSAESSATDWCLSAGSGVITGEGRNVLQVAYSNDSDYKDEWQLLGIGSDAFLLGIKDSGRDRATVLGKIMPYIDEMGYDDFRTIVTDFITCSSVKTYMAESRIFVSRSHGNSDGNGSYIILSEDTTQYIHSCDIYNFSTNTALVDLTNCDLMLFVGCYTGLNDDTSLPYAAVAAGADCAIGFMDTINWVVANEWTEYFFTYYASGFSAERACYAASSNFMNVFGVDSYRVVE